MEGTSESNAAGKAMKPSAPFTPQTHSTVSPQQPQTSPVHNGPSVFSTRVGKQKPRAVDVSDPSTCPSPIVRSNMEKDIDEFIAYLRQEFPHHSYTVFAPWDIRDYFDHHDSILLGERFCYSILRRMQEYNERVLVQFCNDWQKRRHSHFELEQLVGGDYNVCTLFTPNDFEHWGNAFLKRCFEMLRVANFKAPPNTRESEASISHQSDLENTRRSSDVSHRGPDESRFSDLNSQKSNRKYPLFSFPKRVHEAEFLSAWKGRKDKQYVHDSSSGTETFPGVNSPRQFRPGQYPFGGESFPVPASAMPSDQRFNTDYVDWYATDLVGARHFSTSGTAPPGFTPSAQRTIVALPLPNAPHTNQLLHPNVPVLLSGPVPGMQPVGMLVHDPNYQAPFGMYDGSTPNTAYDNQPAIHSRHPSVASRLAGQYAQAGNRAPTDPRLSVHREVSAAQHTHRRPYATPFEHHPNSITNDKTARRGSTVSLPQRTGPYTGGGGVYAAKQSDSHSYPGFSKSEAFTTNQQSSANDTYKYSQPDVDTSSTNATGMQWRTPRSRQPRTPHAAVVAEHEVTEYSIPPQRDDIDTLWVSNISKSRMSDILSVLRAAEPSAIHAIPPQKPGRYRDQEIFDGFTIQLKDTDTCRRLLMSRIGEDKTSAVRFRLKVPYRHQDRDQADQGWGPRRFKNFSRANWRNNRDQHGKEADAQAQAPEQMAVKYSAQDARSSLTPIAGIVSLETVGNASRRDGGGSSLKEHQMPPAETQKSKITSQISEVPPKMSTNKEGPAAARSWADIAATGLSKAPSKHVGTDSHSQHGIGSELSAQKESATHPKASGDYSKASTATQKANSILAGKNNQTVLQHRMHQSGPVQITRFHETSTGQASSSVAHRPTLVTVSQNSAQTPVPDEAKSTSLTDSCSPVKQGDSFHKSRKSEPQGVALTPKSSPKEMKPDTSDGRPITNIKSESPSNEAESSRSQKKGNQRKNTKKASFGKDKHASSASQTSAGPMTENRYAHLQESDSSLELGVSQSEGPESETANADGSSGDSGSSAVNPDVGSRNIANPPTSAEPLASSSIQVDTLRKDTVDKFLISHSREQSKGKETDQESAINCNKPAKKPESLSGEAKINQPRTRPWLPIDTLLRDLFTAIYTHSSTGEKRVWYQEAHHMTMELSRLMFVIARHEKELVKLREAKAEFKGRLISAELEAERSSLIVFEKKAQEMYKRVSDHHEPGEYKPPVGAREFVDSSRMSDSKPANGKITDITSKESLPSTSTKISTTHTAAGASPNVDGTAEKNVGLTKLGTAGTKIEGRKPDLSGVMAGLRKVQEANAKAAEQYVAPSKDQPEEVSWSIRKMSSKYASSTLSEPSLSVDRSAAVHLATESSTLASRLPHGSKVDSNDGDAHEPMRRAHRPERETEESASPNSFVTANNTPDMKLISQRERRDQTPTKTPFDSISMTPELQGTVRQGQVIPALPRRPTPKSSTTASSEPKMATTPTPRYIGTSSDTKPQSSDGATDIVADKKVVKKTDAPKQPPKSGAPAKTAFIDHDDSSIDGADADAKAHYSSKGI